MPFGQSWVITFDAAMGNLLNTISEVVEEEYDDQVSEYISGYIEELWESTDTDFEDRSVTLLSNNDVDLID